MSAEFSPFRPFIKTAPKAHNHTDDPGGPQTGVMLQSREKLKRPALYRVMILNDDFTPMEFVIDVLEKVFHKSKSEATELMLQVHQRGAATCGVYTYEIAETRVAQVAHMAKQAEHPLQSTMERE